MQVRLGLTQMQPDAAPPCPCGGLPLQGNPAYIDQATRVALAGLARTLFINKDGYLMQRDDQSSEWVPTNKHLSETVTAPGPEPEPEEPDQDKNELQLIVDAESFIGKEVYKRFIQDQEDFGVYKGYVAESKLHTALDRWIDESQTSWEQLTTTQT
eukprot:COSAG06_NODE_4465_length_4228_cov_26.232986_1_plen_156_part_00